MKEKSVYKTKILSISADKITKDLFGAKYNFELYGVVQCPEFLVYFSLLEEYIEKIISN